MRQLDETTDFQKKCMQDTIILVKRITGKQIDFKKTIGRKETFYQGQINDVDIYIYSDEAGFMLNNKDWVICEKPDYDSQEELMKDFLSRLNVQISPKK